MRRGTKILLDIRAPCHINEIEGETCTKNPNGAYLNKETKEEEREKFQRDDFVNDEGEAAVGQAGGYRGVVNELKYKDGGKGR